ncbi:MAG TPA: hypothetical protein VKM55_18140 [Candidatus Lokiarchaeia archaeon]|nr:hypothetical protein [Candidatus Lokiarchaeia archaeon]
MQEFAHDKFSILEHSNTHFSFEQDLDIRHEKEISSKSRAMLYLASSIGALIIVLISFSVAWTITVTVCVIAVVIGFLSLFSSRWFTEGSLCTKMEINTHRNRVKVSLFQRDAKGQVWSSMGQEHVFNIAILKHLEITKWADIKALMGGKLKNLDDDIFVLILNAPELNCPVILYVAPASEDVQDLKVQLETLLAVPLQVAYV